MSYLNVPRIHFLGQFLASPNTINNALLNYDPHITLQDTDPNRPGYEFWNPTGVALFQLNGSNGNGTTLAHCRVTSVMDAAGNLITAHDSLVGATLQTSTAPSPGKIVDLDPDQQQVSQLWGVQVQLVIDGSGAGFTMKPGTYLEVPSLTDLWFARAIASSIGDGTASGIFETVIQPAQLDWHTPDASPLLRQFAAACQDGISIKFTTDAYDGTASSPTFNIGRLVGALGPARPGEPARCSAGRKFIPLQSPVQQITQPSGGPPQPTVPFFWAGAFLVDETRKKAVLDLSNSYQVQGPAGPSADLGTMTAAIIQGGHPGFLSPPLPYDQAQYELTAGIVEVDLTDAQYTQLQSAPLGIYTQQPGSAPTLVLQEEPSGLYVDISQTFLRLSPGESQSVELMARQFGKPLPDYALELDFISIAFFKKYFPNFPDLQDPGQLSPQLNEPFSGITFPRTVRTGADGRATVLVTAHDPQPLLQRRTYIDSQGYFIGGPWQGSGYMWWSSNYAPLSVLVWTDYAIPPHPTWETDVFPVMHVYMRLYPGMKSILDLEDYAVVQQDVAALQRVLSAAVTDPRHMPVTRDLTPAKVQMALRWLAQGLPRGAGTV